MLNRYIVPPTLAKLSLPILTAFALALAGGPVAAFAQEGTTIQDGTTIEQNTTGQTGQTDGNTVAQNQTNIDWLWWVLPLAALGILFLLLRRNVDEQDERFNRYEFEDDRLMAGAKGGEVERRRRDDAEEDDSDPGDHEDDDWNITK